MSGTNIHHSPLLRLATLAGALLMLVCLTGCSELLLPNRGLPRARQQCVECGLRDGTATSSDPDAAGQFSKWCAAGDPASCSALGVMYETGRGVERDIARAEQLYQRACRKGNGGACVNLGRMLTQRKARHRDVEAAKVLFELACVQGDLDGCFELGKQRYLEEDYEQAATALSQGCSAKHGASCETLAVMYEHGLGVQRDLQRAHHLLRNACLGGRPTACDRLGRLTHPHRQHASLRPILSPQ